MACSLNSKKFLHYILTKFIKIFTLPLNFEAPLKGQPSCRPEIFQPPLTGNFQKFQPTLQPGGKNYDENCNRVKVDESYDIQERVVIKVKLTDSRQHVSHAQFHSLFIKEGVEKFKNALKGVCEEFHPERRKISEKERNN